MNLFEIVLGCILAGLLIAAIAFVLYVGRPRVAPLEIDESLSDEARVARGIEPIPDTFKPKMGFVVYAPMNHDGINQYSIPSIDAYCARHAMDLYVIRNRYPTSLLGTLKKALRLIDMPDCPYDYMYLSSGHLVITNPTTDPRELAWRYLAKHPEKTFATNESCSSPFLCDNIWYAYNTGRAEDLYNATPGTSLVVLKVRNDTVNILKNWIEDMESGFLPGNEWYERMSLYPHNIVSSQGTNFLTSRGSTAKPLLGYYCSTGAQVRKAFGVVPGKNKLQSVQEMHARQDNDEEYSFKYMI